MRLVKIEKMIYLNIFPLQQPKARVKVRLSIGI